MENVFVTRQAVLDRDFRLHAYELLFRSGAKRTVTINNGDSATSEVIMSTFSAFTVDDLVGDSTVLLNLSRRYLLEPGSLPLPRQRTVIQVLQDIRIDDEIIEAAQKLKQRGYALALDDFHHSRASEQLLQTVDVVKLDMPTLLSSQGTHLVDRLRRFDVTVIAGNIEDYSQFERCQAIGCDYFQGPFLGRPASHCDDLSGPNRSSLALLASVHDPHVDLADLEHFIRKDKQLAEKLLNYINTAIYHQSFEIRELRQAIMMLGLNEIRRWASIIALCDVPGKPHELSKLLLVRARMAELLSLEMAPEHSDACFIAGLMSGLDAVFDIPMETLLGELSLPDDIEQALLYREGPIGHVIQAAVSYEENDPSGLHLPQLTAEQVRQYYLDAIHWQQQQRRLF